MIGDIVKKEKVLAGYGVDVRVGDYVSITYHDTGYFGTKGPQVFKERGILKANLSLQGEVGGDQG